VHRRVNGRGPVEVRSRRAVAILAAVLTGVVLTGLVLMAPAAGASLFQPEIISEIPSRTTPHAVDDSTVRNAAVKSFSQVGGVMYAGGNFHTVQNPARTLSYTRHNLFSFSVSTGTPTPWAPQVNATVRTTVAAGGYLYVGGSFTAANGVSGQLVRYALSTGRVDTGWHPAGINGTVSDLQMVGGRLFVAGSFPGALLALDPATGAKLSYLNLPIRGSVAANAGRTSVTRFAVSGSRLVGIGNFTTVASSARSRAFMLDLGSTTATLDPWYYAQLAKMCWLTTTPAYLRDVDFSPDGSYFVLVAAGRVPRAGDLYATICDAAARFETNVPNPYRPMWINYTGGDTLLSVAAVGSAVYVGGHQRWLDNPYGQDSCGPGCVSRNGVGAIDPKTGKALAWNPGKTRGVGLGFIYPTPTGIWWGSDGRLFHNTVHDSIAFTPLP
jgi:hypothetical protein